MHIYVTDRKSRAFEQYNSMKNELEVLIVLTSSAGFNSLDLTKPRLTSVLSLGQDKN